MRRRAIVVLALVASFSMLWSHEAFGLAVTFTTSPSNVSGWSLVSAGANSTPGGTIKITVGAQLSGYHVTVFSDKARMSEYSGGAYVSGGKSLGAALNVITSRTGGNCSNQGSGGTVAVSMSEQTVVSGNGGILCNETFSVNMSQTTAITDPALTSGHTYHIILTYTLYAGIL